MKEFRSIDKALAYLIQEYVCKRQGCHYEMSTQ